MACRGPGFPQAREGSAPLPIGAVEAEACGVERIIRQEGSD